MNNLTPRIDVSVIIPLYNGALLLNRCLDSVFNQQTQYTFEVIIIDDGSTDNSIELIHRRKEKNIVLIQQQNSGPAIARNNGVKIARGEYCTYLDADDYWLPEYIEKSINLLKKYPELIAVNTGQKHIIVGKGSKINPEYLETYSGLKDGFILDDFYSFWSKHNHVGTCSTTIKTDVLLDSGGQRSDLRICEDLEFWPYIASFGKWGFIPDILYVSDGGLVQSKYGWNKFILRFKNILLFNEWFKRLEKKLTEDQIESIRLQLNGVVLGISRALISGGQFKRAKVNLGYYKPNGRSNYLLTFSKYGDVVWYLFAMLYRTYQYLKINLPMIKSKLSF